MLSITERLLVIARGELPCSQATGTMVCILQKLRKRAKQANVRMVLSIARSVLPTLASGGRKLRACLELQVKLAAGSSKCGGLKKLSINENARLRYYHESWWKVEGEPLWYLAGRDSEPDRNLQPGKWYFNDEAEQMDGPYDTREEATDALRAYLAHL